MNPWEKWTTEDLRKLAKEAHEQGRDVTSHALDDFAALLQAERDGKRCVLPVEVLGSRIEVHRIIPGGWRAIGGLPVTTGEGPTQQSAIEGLAAKIRG